MVNLIRKIKILIPNKVKDGFYAMKLARTSKRLDICAAQFALNFHLLDKDLSFLNNKVCLEIGSGWVLSHALICILLGAKKVFVSDIFSHARPKMLKQCISNSTISVIRDVLSPFEDHERIRKRLEKLKKIKKFNLNVLKEMGIEYIAPIDFAKEKLNQPVDFIFSNSVLEHVPNKDIFSLLENISSFLNPNGFMLHNIHLEDHNDIENDPFGFLSIDSSKYSCKIQSWRGNRIRLSEWQKLFNSLNKLVSHPLYSWIREDKNLPKYISQSINNEGVDDLRTSHLCMYSIKQG